MQDDKRNNSNSISDGFLKVFKSILPAPFTIAVVLTLITFIISFIATKPISSASGEYLLQLVDYWETGLWNNGLLVFALQMMLMLVLGHVLALTKPVDRAISYFTEKFCKDTASAVFIVTLLTVLVALFNWGLGLVFGAIFARKVGEHAVRNNQALNYALVGAAGYSGLMVWHGGFSGSSLAKVAESGHIKQMMTGIYNESQLASLPDSIPYGETVFGGMNITISLALIVILPLSMWWMAKRSKAEAFTLPKSNFHIIEDKPKVNGAERLDYSHIMGMGFGILVLAVAIFKAFNHPGFAELKFINPNWINLVLLGLGITLHQHFSHFLRAVDEAISGAAGILIQFPLYFGIMGLMKSSGMVTQMSDFFVSISSETTYPIFTFISAGIVNIFVPSGGGQWAIQGPIIVQAASDLNVPLTKSILAMAYGDQLTNMLQPFWALPLLGITGLRAKEILPYTLFLMLVGIVVFVVGILVF